MMQQLYSRTGIGNMSVAEKSRRFVFDGSEGINRNCSPARSFERHGERWGDHQMRDIRGDLQDRANLIAEQISITQGQFDKHIEQLKSEHQTILEDLKSALHNVHMVIGIEGRRLGNPLSATEVQSQASPRSHRAQQTQPQQPPSDSLIRKVASVGFR
jgi:hypothetical protein